MNKSTKEYAVDIFLVILITAMAFILSYYIPHFLLQNKAINKVYDGEVKEILLNDSERYDGLMAADVKEGVADHGDNEAINTPVDMTEIVLRLISTDEYRSLIRSPYIYYQYKPRSAENMEFSDAVSRLNSVLADIYIDLSDRGVDMDRFNITGNEGVVLETQENDSLVAFLGERSTAGKYGLLHYISSEKTGIPLYTVIHCPAESFEDVIEAFRDMYQEKCGFNLGEAEYLYEDELISSDAVFDCYQSMEYTRMGRRQNICAVMRDEEKDISLKVKVMKVYEDVDEIVINLQ